MGLLCITWQESFAAIMAVALTSLASLPNSMADRPNYGMFCPPGMYPKTTESCVKAGELRIDSKPPGARVYINGKRIGVTPLTVKVAPGRLKVVVKNVSSKKTKTVDVKSGERRRMNFVLSVSRSQEPRGEVKVVLNNRVSLVLVRLFGTQIPQGKNRLRESKLQAFQLGKYEVTRAEWATVMGSMPSACSTPCSDKLPVQNITWFDAVDFVNKLTERHNRDNPRDALTLCYTRVKTQVTWIENCTGYRLPTEAEWEYAARAGTNSLYDFDIKISGPGHQIWYYANSNDAPHAVGLKPSNLWGFHDMHGNVWEWCWDWYIPTPPALRSEPRGPRSGIERVMRGGSYKTREAAFLPTGLRRSSIPGMKNAVQGIRIARTDT